jgi:hypothetical protein
MPVWSPSYFRRHKDGRPDRFAQFKACVLCSLSDPIDELAQTRAPFLHHIAWFHVAVRDAVRMKCYYPLKHVKYCSYQAQAF